MDIFVCYKLTPEQKDIRISNGAVQTDQAEWSVGEYDLVATEAAAQLATIVGWGVKGVSVGGMQLSNSRARKNMLSRGCDELILVQSPELEQADSHQTARALADAITETGGYGLIVCGEGSADLYFRQVGIQLGELLGLPVINSIQKLVTIEDGVLVAERINGSTVEVLEIPLPAVVSVTSDICKSRIPKMKEILQAGKKPVRELDAAGIRCKERGGETLGIKAPKAVERRGIVLDGTPEEMAEKLLAQLRKEGLLGGV